MDQNDKDEAIAALEAVGAMSACHRCSNPEMAFMGYSHVPVKPRGSSEMVNIPIAGAVLTTCTRCGCVNFHSTVTLGLEARLSQK